MDNITRNHHYIIDLDKPLAKQSGIAFAEGDNGGDVFTFELRRSGAAIDLNGLVQISGYFIRPDEGTVVITGENMGSYGRITLPRGCYAMSGRCALTIKVVYGNITTSVLILDGYVRQTTTEVSVDPNSGASTGGTSVAGAVRYDTAQNLTDEEKSLARANIGVNADGVNISGLIDNVNFSYDKAMSSATTLEMIQTFGGSGGGGGAAIDDSKTSTSTTWSSSKIAAQIAANTGNAGGSGSGTSSSGPVTIECWGDSLTEGYSANGYDYPAWLQSYTGLTVMNYGVGGENCETILARMGATPMYVHGITIPENGSVAISKDKLRSATGEMVFPVKQGKDRTVNKITVNGEEINLTIDGIAGTLVCIKNGEDWEYTFTRKYPGEAKTITTPVEVVTAYANSNPGNIVRVIWMGQNDIIDADMGSDVSKMAPYIIEACRAAVRGVDKYIILTAPITSADYKVLHRTMAHAFGDHCINVMDYLIRHGLSDAIASEDITSATDADNTNIANYKIPRSLRATNKDSNGNDVEDHVHLNAFGYKIVAKLVYRRGQELGYW